MSGKTSRDEANQRFFALRESGYRGAIDHNGDAVEAGREVEHLRRVLAVNDERAGT